MKRFNILHETRYSFEQSVSLQAHMLRLRPREGHELRIESSRLDIEPKAFLRWHRDAEGNSVATATFADQARILTIISEVVIQQYDQVPHDFVVAAYAVNYPFSYVDDDVTLLSPYMRKASEPENEVLSAWLGDIWQTGEAIQTFALLLRLNQRIWEQLSYRVREEEGVQTPEQTLKHRSGSCRDSASLFMAAARHLGFAARFVSGYVCSDGAEMLPAGSGSTHAWAEVFIPGAGWKGFDPSIGNIVGTQHITVNVAMRPESVPPISGSYQGSTAAQMAVSVNVTELV
ncbi:MAG: transglutaminase N-terminal domain-containing protein [Congregibacter sp.]